MKVLFVNAGNETGGGRSHIIGLMKAMVKLGQDSPSLLVFEDGPVAESARSNNLNVKVISQPRIPKPSFFREIKSYINKENFEVVHSHGPRANLFLNIIRKGIKSKWVVTLHTLPEIDYLNKGIKGKLLLPVSLKVIKNADQVYLIAERFRKSLVDRGVSNDKMTTIFNAIEFNSERPKPRRQDIFTIICVARLTAQKHQELLLQAASRVDFKFKLHLIGDGELEEPLKALSKELNIESSVIFDGFQTNVEKFYEETDISALSSIHEGFPTVLLESGDHGIPAIATDVGDSKVIIDSEDYGWIVDSLDIDGYVKALNEAHEAYQHNNLVGMGEKFYDHVSSSFSTEKLAKLMNHLYSLQVNK